MRIPCPTHNERVPYVHVPCLGIALDGPRVEFPAPFANGKHVAPLNFFDQKKDYEVV